MGGRGKGEGIGVEGCCAVCWFGGCWCTLWCGVVWWFELARPGADERACMLWGLS